MGSYSDDTYLRNVTMWRLQKMRHLYYKSVDLKRPYMVAKDPRDSIRIATVAKVFPTARFVQIVRDGRDVVASILKTSQNELYVTDDGWPHVRIPGYKGMLKDPPHVNAARQWVYCVQSSRQHLSKIAPQNQITLKYEDLVKKPSIESRKVLSFLYREYDDSQLVEVLKGISDRVERVSTDEPTVSKDRALSWHKRMHSLSNNVIGDAGSGTMSKGNRIGKWRSLLTADMVRECYAIMKDSLQYLGYD
jgi:hypothetical protein